MAITKLRLLALLLRAMAAAFLLANPILPLALRIVGSTGVISIGLPYTAENHPRTVRGRATGWVAGCSKLGGLMAQGRSMLALIPARDIAAVAIAVPAALSVLLIANLGREPQNRDARELDLATTRSR